MHIRKQVYDLTTDDLRHHPLWEFCLDEEGMPGQDEATMKPSDDLEVPAYSPGAYVVATDFTLADGSSMEGYIYSGEPDDFGCIQPNIVLDTEQIGFWFGIRAPSRSVLDALYARLSKTPEQMFPISYTTRVFINGSRMSGSVVGFGTRAISDPKPRLVR
jgi:hypothetical protein